MWPGESGEVETAACPGGGEIVSAAAISSGGFGAVAGKGSSLGAGAGLPPEGRGVVLCGGRGTTLALAGDATRGGGRMAETCGEGCGWVSAHDESITTIRPSRAAEASAHRCSRQTGLDTIRLAMAASSTACEALDGADVAVSVDRKQLVIVQEDIGLVASVAIEFSNGIALVGQRVREFLPEVGLARDEARESLAVSRLVGKPKHAAA